MKKIFFLMQSFILASFFCISNLKADEDVIKDVFISLKRDYINELDNRQIALKGLKSLLKLSKNIELKQTSKKIVLYQNGKMIKQFAMPQDKDNINAWVDFCNDIIDEALKTDNNIRPHDFEMSDLFAKSVFEGLDGYSHYFGAFEKEDDKPLKIRRPFASRIIDDILLIKVLSFKKDISKQVQTAVEECSKCQGLILDLRNNHGGFLNEALKIADMFLDEGIITYTLASDNDAPKYYTAGSGDIFYQKPMVILTDGLTASASEVLAAALSEQNRAVLIGTKTYGKGTIQDIKKMGKERAMTITTAYFYTPSGIKIDKTGLTPFICVGKDADCTKADRFNKDEDIELAVKYLKTGVAD